MPASLPPPTGGRPRAQDLNVPSGTCADSVIVHPRYREFIMTSQQANIVSHLQLLQLCVTRCHGKEMDGVADLGSLLE